MVGMMIFRFHGKTEEITEFGFENGISKCPRKKTEFDFPKFLDYKSRLKCLENDKKETLHITRHLSEALKCGLKFPFVENCAKALRKCERNPKILTNGLQVFSPVLQLRSASFGKTFSLAVQGGGGAVISMPFDHFDCLLFLSRVQRENVKKPR